MNEIIKIVTGCSDCPMKRANDMGSGYSCTLIPITQDDFIRQNKKFQPITPAWCPLKNNNITFKFKSNE